MERTGMEYGTTPAAYTDPPMQFLEWKDKSHRSYRRSSSTTLCSTHRLNMGLLKNLFQHRLPIALSSNFFEISSGSLYGILQHIEHLSPFFYPVSFKFIARLLNSSADLLAKSTLCTATATSKT
ncbi:hypothetical protein F2Q70_00028111 [Brassica cretica]|uniref:RNase H type-1 domain-containing protein n=1 Tax=Brassica cretica TaxID=69181 RepID=A0A8S9LCS8_BRACR|nr:hypothetical protein F2Q68_00027685 [Brassica cretica]KAF2603807.1 hypothetical protein F2Q70_00028111 [Brassica cretica]